METWSWLGVPHMETLFLMGFSLILNYCNSRVDRGHFWSDIPLLRIKVELVEGQQGFFVVSFDMDRLVGAILSLLIVVLDPHQQDEHELNVHRRVEE